MDLKKVNAPVNTETYDRNAIDAPTENIYEAISVISRRAEQINTEIRNPTDGKLAKLSPNSTIIYKIQRNAIVPNPEIDVFGKATVEQKQPDPNKEELDKIFLDFLHQVDNYADGIFFNIESCCNVNFDLSASIGNFKFFKLGYSSQSFFNSLKVM